MNITDVVSDARSIITVISMLTFIGIVLWAYRSERNIPGSYPKIELKWKQIYTLKGEKS